MKKEYIVLVLIKVKDCHCLALAPSSKAQLHHGQALCSAYGNEISIIVLPIIIVEWHKGLG